MPRLIVCLFSIPHVSLSHIVCLHVALAALCSKLKICSVSINVPIVHFIRVHFIIAIVCSTDRLDYARAHTQTRRHYS